VITIVDYGLGNVLAFANLYQRLNIDVSVAREPSELEGASKIILPGVGAFDHAIKRLNESNMRPTLERLVLEVGVPVLGVCVGMQMFARSSDEGALQGLGWIPGRVRALRSLSHFDRPLPHMGWNDVTPALRQPLFGELTNNRFYFLHSYFFECDQAEDIAATCSYGVDFACAVRRASIFGVQFHPEKSHRSGIELLRAFADLQHAPA